MKKVQHHPDSDTLASFAAGTLTLSQAMCLSAHLEQCPECRTNLAGLERLGGQLMDQLSPREGSESLKEKVFAQLDDLPQSTVTVSEKRNVTGVPRCLKQFVAEDYSKLAWKRISPSIHSVELCRDVNGAKVELLRIKPGGSAATHTHVGEEMTVILQGSFSDEEGIYREGDFISRDARHKHTPVATKDKVCLCLVVTEGPVQFTGFFSRLFNPILRKSYALS